VHDLEYTGEVATKLVGEWCNVNITVGDGLLGKQWLSQERRSPDKEQAYRFHQIDLKEHLTEVEVHYMSPGVEGGVFKQAVMVSHGRVVAEVSTMHGKTSGPKTQSKEVEVATIHASDTE